MSKFSDTRVSTLIDVMGENPFDPAHRILVDRADVQQSALTSCRKDDIAEILETFKQISEAEIVFRLLKAPAFEALYLCEQVQELTKTCDKYSPEFIDKLLTLLKPLEDLQRHLEQGK